VSTAVPVKPLSPPDKARLAAEILAAWARARRRLRAPDLRATLADLRSAAPAGGGAVLPDPRRDGVRLGSAVQRTLRFVPADTRCLVQSLVLTRLLARRGEPGAVVIAVSPPGEAFGAHAWVELDGRPLLPANDPEQTRLAEL
jgi:Transglutaminase-like superfamily